MNLKYRLPYILSFLLVTSPAMSGAVAPTAAARANNDFGWSVFSQIQQERAANENILFSPLSAWLALSLASNGTEQETLEEIQGVLHHQTSLVDANKSVHDLAMNLLNNPRSGEVLSIANSVWVNSDQFDLGEQFQSNAETFYTIVPDEEIVTAASFQEQATIDQINAWVSKSTKGMIPTILQQLNPDMAAILLNALYFQGQWMEPFAEALTSSGDFHTLDGATRTVDMLHDSGKFFQYASTDRYKMLSLGFRSAVDKYEHPIPGRFQLDLVIPVENTRSVLNLKQADYERLVGLLHRESVRLSIPKFAFSYENSLKDELEKAGIQRAFIPGSAQMDPLGTPKLAGAKAFISDVLQKTAVQMDEFGFKAAAVTAVIAGTTAQPVDTATFIADRPFFLALRDRETGTLLFQGMVMNP